jgi:hypothetical protein
MSMLEGFTQGINIRLIGTSNIKGTMDEAVTQMDRFKSSAQGLLKLGGALVGVGTALAGFAVLTVKSTNATTKALGEMAAIGFQDIASLENAATEFSSQFAGYTKPDFIAAAYDIKSAIYTLSDVAIGEYTKIAALTAKATKATVAQMTSLFGTGYGIYKDFYRDLSDFDFAGMLSGGISQAVISFKTTGPELAGAISNLGASATSALRPLEEQLTVLGLLSATMSGPESGTMYRAFIKSVAQAGERLGVSFVDQKNNLLPIADILEKIKGKYGETVDAMEKLQLQEAFGRIESLGVVDLLLPKIADIRSNMAAVKQAMQDGTETTLQMAQAMNEDLGAQLELLSQRIHNSAESLGKTLLPMVAPLVKSVSDAAMAFGKWAEANPILTKIGMAFALVAGAVGTVVGGLALAGAGLQFLLAGIIKLAVTFGVGSAASLTFSTALGGLAGMLWGLVAPLLPVIAVLGGLYLAWRINLLGFRDTALAVWSVLQQVFTSLQNTFVAVGSIVGRLFAGWIADTADWFTSWNSCFTGIRSPLLSLAGLIAYVVGFSVELFNRIAGWFGEHKGLGAALGVVFAGGAVGVLKYLSATGGLVNGLSVLPYYLRVAGAEIKYLALKMATVDFSTLPMKLKSSFLGMLGSVRSTMIDLATSVRQGFSSAVAFASSAGRSLMTWTLQVGQGIGFLVKQIGLLGWSFLKAAGEAALFVGRLILARIAMIAQAVTTGIVTAAQWALNLAMTANPIGLIIAGVALLIGGIYLLYKHWDTVWAGMKAAASAVWDFLVRGWNRFVGFFRDMFPMLSAVIGGLGSLLSGVFTGIWGGLKRSFALTLDWIIGKLNGLLKGVNALGGLVGIDIPLIPTIATGGDLAAANPEKLTPSIPLASPSAESFKTNLSGSVISNSFATDRSSRPVHIDRSIRDVRIEINANGQDSRSIKEQLTEFFSELAAQGDSIEGIAFDR